MLTSLHYADGINSARDKAFRSKYAVTCKAQPDIYAVQGYDAAQILAAGLSAVKVKGRENLMTGIAVKVLADPARGCKM